MHLPMREFWRGWIVGLAATVLGGCAIIPGPVGSSTGNFPVTNRVSFGDEPAPAVEAVGKVLARRGYLVATEADFRVDVGLAKRAVEVGFRGEPATAGRSSGVEALPEDRRIDLCREHIFRLSVAIVDRRSGLIVYRGTAEDVRCGEPGADNLLALANVALHSLQ